jgi:hypothetical protein
MLSLANRLKNADDQFVFDDIVLPQLPPRQPAEIIALLKRGFAKKISLLEWINVFQSHEYFSALSYKGIIESYDLIWSELRRNQKLQRIALWRICLYFDGQTLMMPSKLLKDCLKPLRQMQADKPRKSVMATIAVVEDNMLDVADYSLSMSKTPTSLFASLRLPSRLSILNNSKESLEKALVSKGVGHFSANYIAIIESYSDLDCDQAVQRLLSCVNNEKLTTNEALLDFLKRNYAQNIKGSRWQHLDSDSHLTLRKIIGSAWFVDFKNFVFQMTERASAEALNLNETAINQLRNRVSFWSNYQSRFINFKVFLPTKTSQVIKQLGFETSTYGSIDDLSHIKEETELCLLEFENYVIVEYLRGSASPVKVYKKSQKLKDIFTSETVYIDVLHRLEFAKEHDHRAFWQRSCEIMLRKIFSIYPDDNLKNFEIVSAVGAKPRFVQKYDRKRGLPHLSAEKLKRREQDLRGYNMSGTRLADYQSTISSDNNDAKKSNIHGDSPIKSGEKVELPSGGIAIFTRIFDNKVELRQGSVLIKYPLSQLNFMKRV